MSSFMEELEANSIGTHDRDRVIGCKWWFDYGGGRLSEGDWDADEVKQMFSHCGKVEKANPNSNPNPNPNPNPNQVTKVVLPWLGAAEVRFENKESVAKALEMHKTFYTGVAF